MLVIWTREMSGEREVRFGRDSGSEIERTS